MELSFTSGYGLLLDVHADLNHHQLVAPSLQLPQFQLYIIMKKYHLMEGSLRVHDIESKIIMSISKSITITIPVHKIHITQSYVAYLGTYIS